MWPEPVERVARELRAAAIDATIHEFPRARATAEAAATAIGCPLDEIVKSLVFVCDGTPRRRARPGRPRAPTRRESPPPPAPRRSGSRRPPRCVAATGFEPGAVAPFPLPRSLRVLIERTLLQHARVWVCAGSPTHMAALAPAELQQLTGAETADLLGPRYSSTTDR